MHFWTVFDFLTHSRYFTGGPRPAPHLARENLVLLLPFFEIIDHVHNQVRHQEKERNAAAA